MMLVAAFGALAVIWIFVAASLPASLAA